MTQRTEGFTAGIKAGTTAYDPISTKLDVLVKEAGKDLGGTKGAGAWVSSYSASTLNTKLGITGGVGMSPDGGIFLKPGNEAPLMIVEAKKQGSKGNAIERMFKNIQLSKFLGTQKYLVITTGEGFFDGNSAERICRTALGIYNDISNPAQFDFGSHDGFLEIHRIQTEDIDKETITEILKDTLSSIGE